jgi:hypothetical protein
MNYLGVDPGASGGIVILSAEGKCLLKLDLSKTTEPDIVSCLKMSRDAIVFCVLEKVSSMPGQGVSSTFKFGRSYGLLTGILMGLQIPFEEVTPQVWQKSFSIGKHASRTEHKRALKQKAQELFPSESITLNTADAFLLAEYCRRSRV